MNIAALDCLLKDNIELIETSAKSAKVDVDAAIGVSRQVVGENTINNLTERQLYIFNEAIRPLIEDLKCSGQWNEVAEEGYCGRLIPDENLVSYYQRDETLCESCQSLSDAQQQTKARIMRE